MQCDLDCTALSCTALHCTQMYCKHISHTAGADPVCRSTQASPLFSALLLMLPRLKAPCHGRRLRRLRSSCGP